LYWNVGTQLDDLVDQFTIEEKDLDIGPAIGKGMFGAVYKGTYYGTKVAIKKLFISGIPADTLVEFNKECAIMKQLRHPNIVLFMGSCCQPPSLLLVTELLDRGSFFDIYHKSSQPVSVVDHLMLSMNIAIDMCKGMGYLHNLNPQVIHRDLKSQNIMLDEKWTTKIGDFGLSRFKDAGKTMSMCGSPLWVAPEVLRGEMYGVGCDIFSFGIIMWETLAWSEPYPDMSSNDVMSGIAAGTLRPEQPSVCPSSIFALLEESWSEDPDMRPPMEDLVFRFEEIKDKIKAGETLQ
jgi:Janus kinase 2